MKPDCQIIHGDCRTELAKLPEKSDSDAGTVEFADVQLQAFHLFANVRGAFGSTTTLSAPGLQRTKLEAHFGLRALDAKEWQEEFKAMRRPLICSLPYVKRLAAFGRSTCYAFVATKVGMEKFDRMWFYLFDAYALGIRWLRRGLYHSHSIGVPLYADCTISVNNTRTVREYGFRNVESRK